MPSLGKKPPEGTRRARRAFLRKIGWAVSALAVGGVSWLMRGRAHQPLRQKLAEENAFAVYVSGPLRPPGSVEEGLFRKRCTGCYLCGEVCPVKAIRFIEGIGPASVTPVIFPGKRGCMLCMRCTRVCPTGAIAPLDESQASEVRMGVVRRGGAEGVLVGDDRGRRGRARVGGAGDECDVELCERRGEGQGRRGGLARAQVGDGFGAGLRLDPAEV